MGKTIYQQIIITQYGEVLQWTHLYSRSFGTTGEFAAEGTVHTMAL